MLHYQNRCFSSGRKMFCVVFDVMQLVVGRDMQLMSETRHNAEVESSEDVCIWMQLRAGW